MIKMGEESEVSKPEVQESADGTALSMTPSADDILGVSPVNSFDTKAMQSPVTTTPARVASKKPPKSPSDDQSKGLESLKVSHHDYYEVSSRRDRPASRTNNSVSGSI